MKKLSTILMLVITVITFFACMKDSPSEPPKGVLTVKNLTANDGFALGDTIKGVATAVMIDLSKMELYFDGSLKASSSSDHYFFAIPTTGLSLGTHSVKIVAYGADGYLEQTIPISLLNNVQMVLVEGGTFSMGDASVAPPVHSVTLSSFYIGSTEVTQAQWVAVMGTNPSYITGDLNRPVERVSWYDIMVFCNKKSILDGLAPCYSISGSTDPTVWGTVPTDHNAIWNDAICNWAAKGYRMPTEAEWEFAAKGGNSSRGYTYSGSNTIGDVAWYNSNSGRTTHVIDTKVPNELGLYDMSGNVWEWNWDWYAAYTTATQTNPTGSATGSSRILRGGGCTDDASSCLVVDRHIRLFPYNRFASLGFRVVRSP